MQLLAASFTASTRSSSASPAADNTIELTFWTEPRAICVEVVDHGCWRVPSDQSNGRGRGIQIMQRLVAFVLIHHDNRGTRVLLRHPLPRARERDCHRRQGSL